MLSEIDVLKDVTRRLDALSIPYMLTGSFAMSYWAAPRMTRDIDLVVALAEPDLAALTRAFGDAYYIPEAAARRAVAARTSFNVIHVDSVVKVDLIVRKQGVYREHEFARRQSAEFEGSTIWIVSKEDLVLSKLAWAAPSHSELQLRDAANLVRTGCDIEYLRHWARELGLTGLLSEVLP